MMRILSYGAGVNTTAILALAKLKRIESIDVAIFSDTGGELKETYEHIEKVVKPLCKELGIKFIEVRKEGETLYEECWRAKIFPFRRSRSCSDKYKIRPIHKWIIENTDMEVVSLLGFEKGEEHRAREGVDIPQEYPLIELGLDRAGCYEIIKEVDTLPPLKSGCFFCPFASVKWYKWLWDTHLEEFAMAEALEKNSRHYPKHTITRIPLEEIRKRQSGTEPTYLEEYSEEGCCAHCR